MNRVEAQVLLAVEENTMISLTVLLIEAQIKKQRNLKFSHD